MIDVGAKVELAVRVGGAAKATIRSRKVTKAISPSMNALDWPL